MTKNITISIPEREIPLWNAWKQFPANKNSSAAILRLVRRDLLLRRGEQ